MTSTPTLPPPLRLTAESGSSREQSILSLTPRRRSASANRPDIQRSHSVPPHLMSASNSRHLPASPTVSESSSSSNGSVNSTSSASTSSVANDDELDTAVGSLPVNNEPRLVKSTSTPGGLTNSLAVTRSTSAASTSSASSLPFTATVSASSPSLYSSSSLSSTASLSSSTAAALSSTLASLTSTVASTVASLFRQPSPPNLSSASSTPSPRLIPYYSLDTIAKHNTADSFWTIVHGRVYDLTAYLPLHPGGYRLLFKNGGTDSTSDFVGLRHSKRAVAILDAYWIGDVVGTRPMREVPAGLGSAVKVPKEGCVAVGSFGASGAGGMKRAAGGSGMLGDALRLGDGVEGVRRSHSAGPSNNGRVVPLNLQYQPAQHNITPPSRAQVSSTPSSSASSPRPQSPPSFTINLITPPESSSTFTAPDTSDSASSSASSAMSIDLAAPLTFTVSSIKHISADTVQLVFRLPPAATPASFSMPLSGHITIEVPSTSSSEPLRRQYTPIASTASSFTLLVKRYTAQQLGSHYLASLNVGEHVTVHGPYTSLAHSVTAFRDVVLLCMGSGMTPMYQLLQHVHKLSTSSPAAVTPRVHLLYSVRHSSDVWLRQPIDNTFALHQSDWHHTYLLSRAGSDTGSRTDERRGRLDNSELYGWLERCGVELGAGVLCCVCGTDDYLAAVSGWLRNRWRAQTGDSISSDSGPIIHNF